MISDLRILFVADLNAYSKGMGRVRALQDLDVPITALSHTATGGAESGFASITMVDRILWKLGVQRDKAGINRRLLDAAKEVGPHIIWIEKGNMIRPSALRALRRIAPDALLVSYAEDDMFLAHNRTRAYVKGLSCYDCVFTTKAPNVGPSELPAQTLASSGLSRPRARSLSYLAENGIAVRVWGNGWEAWAARPPGLIIEDRAVVNTEHDLAYTKSLCATRINLGFLRKLNRDTQTDRTMEIPACGAFMLAERSDDHLRLFEEGREAAFFGSDDELLEKVRYYLGHEDERAAIARAGRQKCLDAGYSETERMRGMIDQCRA